MKDSLSMWGDCTLRNSLHSFFRAGTFIVLAVSLCGSLPALAEWSLFDGALVHPEYHGQVPKKSDVIFSTRSLRPEALDAIGSFRATRVEWSYAADIDYVRAVKDRAGWFGGTLNSNQPMQNDDGMAKDFDGNTLIHPRMKAWGGKWITSTHPTTELALQGQIAKFIEAGADSIQIDDPLLQVYAAYQWGGDFNQSTLDGFNQYVASYPDKVEVARLGLDQLGTGSYKGFLVSRYGIRDGKDYLARYKELPTNILWEKYLRETVRRHYKEMRMYMDRLRGQRVPLSMNLAFTDRPDETQWDFFLTSLADYVITETPIGNPNEIITRATTMRAIGLGYVPSIKPRKVGENRLAIAMLYSLGAQPLVPWDIYIGNNSEGQPERYYGTVTDYGDLYMLARKHPELFDDLEMTSVVGIPVPVDKFSRDETTRLAIRLIQRNVPFSFIPMGGSEIKYKWDSAKASNFRLLISVNPDEDYSADDLRKLFSIPVKRVHANEVSDAFLADLSPFIPIGAPNTLRIFPRANPIATPNKLIMHIIDVSRSDQRASEPDCQSEIRLRKSMVGDRRIKAAKWISADGVIDAYVKNTEKEPTIIVRECRLWGVLSIQIE